MLDHATFVGEFHFIDPQTSEENHLEIYREVGSGRCFGIEYTWEGSFPEAREKIAIRSPYQEQTVTILDPEHVDATAT
jgi:hypothetical protein